MKLRSVAAFDLLEDAPLGVDGESLVEPEIVRAEIRDEVPGPRVRKLVRDHVHERPVAGEDRRREEGESRVLHAAVGERGRKDEDVEPFPGVLAEERLCGGDEVFDPGELERGVGDDRGLGPGGAAR